jgi:hypothetical protein
MQNTLNNEIMAKKFFPVKLEELPVIGEFVLNSAKKDLSEFSAFSSLFSSDYLMKIEAKNTACRELVSSSTISKELKAVTQQLKDKSGGLRVKLNSLEGYLILAASDLDISVPDVGLKNVRHVIANGNTEGLLSNMKKSLTAVKRNLPALEAKGLSPKWVDGMEAEMKVIDLLNAKQNDLISERNRLTESNTLVCNELWESLQPILKTAKAIYKGVDDAKLKDYTIIQLVKRINADSKKKPAEDNK